MKKLVFTLVLALPFVFASCSNDQDPSTEMSEMSVRLTDAPGDYEHVYVDVQGLEIHSDEEGWVSMTDVQTGVYDLLEFTNGMDTLLTNTVLPAGRVSQMRMILGENNQVGIDGQLYDLDTPSAQQSGLKFQINADLEAGMVYKLWIDFDAGKSIVETGNGTYSLKPVIRTYSEIASGSIHGSVCVTDAQVYVEAINAEGVAFGTYSDLETGLFQINGLDAGTYQLVYTPAAELTPVTVDGVAVELGGVTELEEQCFETAAVPAW